METGAWVSLQVLSLRVSLSSSALQGRAVWPVPGLLGLAASLSLPLPPTLTPHSSLACCCCLHPKVRPGHLSLHMGRGLLLMPLNMPPEAHPHAGPAALVLTENTKAKRMV